MTNIAAPSNLFGGQSSNSVQMTNIAAPSNLFGGQSSNAVPIPSGGINLPFGNTKSFDLFGNNNQTLPIKLENNSMMNGNMMSQPSLPLISSVEDEEDIDDVEEEGEEGDINSKYHTSDEPELITITEYDSENDN